MAQGTYRREPLFLAVCAQGSYDFALLRSNVKSFFNVPSDVLACLETNRFSALYAPGYFEPPLGSFLNNRNGVMTVTSHPIYDETCAKDSNHGLTRFFGRVHTGELNLEEFPAPLAIFQVKKANESIVCYNDAFGSGRIYYSNDDGVSIVSNSVAAVALARGEVCSRDEDYWSSYYCGGAVGDSTFIRGVSLCPAGTKLVIKPGTFSLQRTPLSSRLVRGAGEQRSLPETLAPLLSPLKVLSEHLSLQRPTIGLSGGRDSRLVVALTLTAAINAEYETWFPPDLETEIATDLVKRLSHKIDWKPIDRRHRPSENPSDPIRVRARDWFDFTGGDNWSTFIRRIAPERRCKTQVEPELSVSGMGGEVTRGSHYLRVEALEGNAEPGLRRFIERPRKYWCLLPPEVRERSRVLNQEVLLDGFIEGLDGFRALDLAEMSTTYRRSIPPPNPGIVPILFNLRLAQRSFEDAPVERLQSKALRELTELLIPEWSGVPYYHEVAEQRNNPGDNKVTAHPTHWESDKEDFLASMSDALRVTDFSQIDMATVEREIESPSDGRNRTNILFETILWHAAAEDQIHQINQLISKR